MERVLVALSCLWAAKGESMQTVSVPTQLFMVNHLGTATAGSRKIPGREVFVWEEGVDDVNTDKFHGFMHFPMESFPSFLEVGESSSAPQPDAQNLSPAALQCYCQFKRPLVETVPASAFNNEGAEPAFIEERDEVRARDPRDVRAQAPRFEEEPRAAMRKIISREGRSRSDDRFDDYDRSATSQRFNDNRADELELLDEEDNYLDRRHRDVRHGNEETRYEQERRGRNDDHDRRTRRDERQEEGGDWDHQDRDYRDKRDYQDRDYLTERRPRLPRLRHSRNEETSLHPERHAPSSEEFRRYERRGEDERTPHHPSHRRDTRDYDDDRHTRPLGMIEESESAADHRRPLASRQPEASRSPYEDNMFNVQDHFSTQSKHAPVKEPTPDYW